MRKKGIYERYIKRIVDIFCALAALTVFGWLYVTVAILVRYKLGSPVLFRQERPGKDEKIFTLYKFRTMSNKRDLSGKLLPDSERLTAFGRFLRKTSLDELPEVFNILKGDMSVIGPRPLLTKYLPLYNERQRRRHEVRPGLSGYAQVNGRNLISWDDKFEKDIFYVDNISFGFDVKLVYMTVVKAFIRHEGIHSETAATMEGFKGSAELAAGKEETVNVG